MQRLQQPRSFASVWRYVRLAALPSAVAALAFGGLAPASAQGYPGMRMAPPFYGKGVGQGGRGGSSSYRPRRPDSRGGRRGYGPGLPGAMIPGVLGVIGTLATTPSYPDYDRGEIEYNDLPPRRRRTARRPPPSLAPPLPPRRPIARGGSGGSGVPPAGEQRFAPDEVVTQMPPGAPPQATNEVAARHRLTPLESLTVAVTGESLVRWRIADQRSVRAVISALQNDSGVNAAQPNYLFTLQQRASREVRGDPGQYALVKLDVPAAHAHARGAGVRVAVIDSGIDGDHPELAGRIVARFDPRGPDDKPDRHGTATAGTIVAHARLLGVAPGARILAVNAFAGRGATATGSTFDILKGLDWATRRGARIINMSFAGPSDPVIGRTLAAARKERIVLVAAAGNAGPDSKPLYPAADPNVIAVTATDSRDRLFERSVIGSHITIAAPGVDILAPAPGGAYQITSGTSLAAAHISAVAALILERHPSIRPDDVRSLLRESARDLGPRGHDEKFGAGLANAYQALTHNPAPPAAVSASQR